MSRCLYRRGELHACGASTHWRAAPIGSWCHDRLEAVVQQRVPAELLDEGAFDRLRESIDPAWIEEALLATGTATLRRRRLPAEQVIWLVLAMALMRRRSIAEVVSKLDLALPGRRVSVAPSAIAQARTRLGDEPMAWLFSRCAEKWAHESADRNRWRDLALYSVDGTTVRVPDTPENRTHFGGHGTRWNGTSGYPLVKAVTLMALRSHILAAARFGPNAASELTYAAGLWPVVPDRSLCIVDRGFFVAAILTRLNAYGRDRHWLTRARSKTKWKVIEQLGSNDAIVEIETDRGARRLDPDIPVRWRVRAISYQRKGFRPQTLLTSMLDSKRFPSQEIAAIYHERWEIELGYDEVKTVMLDRLEAIRSKNPVGVAQELWGVALMYNLVRLEMERIAVEAGVEPTRISFTMALMLIHDEWGWCAVASPGTIPRHLRELRGDVARFVLPPRRERTYPRQVKIKMSNYDRKRPLN